MSIQLCTGWPASRAASKRATIATSSAAVSSARSPLGSRRSITAGVPSSAT